ncbi:MAG: fused MFS/spermidine synthase, partial [Planctomycetota bacterium]
MNAPRRSLWAAALLFVLSGLTGLVYETVWFKRLGHAWGSSSLAMASVVATFLCGLGLGAWIAGRIADRSHRPLALYGWCELGIAGLALLVPFEFGWLLESAAPLAHELSDSPFLLVALRFALTFLVIGPPCVLMGATLPLLTRQFAAQGLSLGASAAWLYAFNALGAAAGAWLAGFFLLEHFGLGWTNALAAATNAAIGIAALALARNVDVSTAADTEPAPVAVEEVSPRALNTAALASGLAS